MQILLDTDTASYEELDAAIEFLAKFRGTAQRDCTPPRVTGETTDDQLERGMDAAAPPPPPAEFTLPPGLHDIGENDVEVEIDSVVAVVELPAAPPPPPPPISAVPVAAATVIPAATAPVSSMAIPAPTPAPPGPAVPAELDSRGMPWDARIHASNRSKTIKQEWKRKRGVDENLVTAVEAQNKPKNEQPIYQGTTVNLIPPPGTFAAAVSTPATPAPAMSAAQAEAATFGHMAPHAVSSHSIPAAPVSPAPALTAPPPPPPPVVGPSSTVSTPIQAPTTAPPDFRGLMQKIQAASAAGKLSAEQVNAALAGVGLRPEEMAQLINNAPLIASVNAAVDACL